MKIIGEVIEGRQLGRKLGFPTANVLIEEPCRVDNGVYHTIVLFQGSRYNGVTNIGTNPTIGNTQRRAESYIIDFDQLIYGSTIEIELMEKIRSEQEFDTIEELRAQIARDVEYVKNNLIR